MNSIKKLVQFDSWPGFENIDQRRLRKERREEESPDTDSGSKVLGLAQKLKKRAKNDLLKTKKAKILLKQKI